MHERVGSMFGLLVLGFFLAQHVASSSANRKCARDLRRCLCVCVCVSLGVGAKFVRVQSKDNDIGRCDSRQSAANWTARVGRQIGSRQRCCEGAASGGGGCFFPGMCA